jgi:hypothetical protein
VLLSQHTKRPVRTLLAAACLLLGVLCGCDRPPTARPSFSVDGDGAVIAHISFENLPLQVQLSQQSDWGEAVQLSCLDTEGQPGPALLSSITVEPNQVTLTPTFSLLPGRSYLLTFDPQPIAELAPLLAAVQLRHDLPANDLAPAPTITAIFPSIDRLPSNHLKFYLVFSEPMQQGEIWDNFSLRDLTENKPVARPFRHTELWSEDNCQLTLWFHPGRQKTGVNLNVELGAILTKGHRYRLSIDGGWLSQRGTALGETVNKDFQAGPADHQQPRITDWQLDIPDAGTRQPLRITFDKSLDWALSRSVIQLRHRSASDIQTVVFFNSNLGPLQRTLELEPLVAWKPGAYELVARGILEDLAGNSLDRPFEVDVSDAAEPINAPSQDHLLPFTITTPAAAGQR